MQLQSPGHSAMDRSRLLHYSSHQQLWNFAVSARSKRPPDIRRPGASVRPELCFVEQRRNIVGVREMRPDRRVQMKALALVHGSSASRKVACSFHPQATQSDSTWVYGGTLSMHGFRSVALLLGIGRAPTAFLSSVFQSRAVGLPVAVLGAKLVSC